MKILITGGNGFIARNIKKYLSQFDYLIDCFGRGKLDLKSDKIWLRPDYDVVIHTAIQGGWGNKSGIPNCFDFYDNLYMFENLVSNIKNDCVLINIASGAEFRGNNIDSHIDNAKTSDLYKSPFPKDFYGLAKNIIAKRVISREHSYNLRLFACFGPDEIPSRFIKSCFMNETVTISKNKFFDFFYVDDVARLVKFLIDDGIPIRSGTISDINCVYPEKKSLHQVAEIIKDRYRPDLKINVESNDGVPYTGSAIELKKISIFMKDKLVGFDKALKEYNEAHKLFN